MPPQPISSASFDDDDMEEIAPWLVSPRVRFPVSIPHINLTGNVELGNYAMALGILDE